MSRQIAYDRFLPDVEGFREIDLFVQKIEDPEEQRSLCSRLSSEMLHPLRVTIASRGPDSELLVANPVELSGIGRPRVFYDVTVALKMLGICIFSVVICFKFPPILSLSAVSLASSSSRFVDRRRRSVVCRRWEDSGRFTDFFSMMPERFLAFAEEEHESWRPLEAR